MPAKICFSPSHDEATYLWFAFGTPGPLTSLVLILGFSEVLCLFQKPVHAQPSRSSTPTDWWGGGDFPGLFFIMNT